MDDRQNPQEKPRDTNITPTTGADNQAAREEKIEHDEEIKEKKLMTQEQTSKPSRMTIPATPLISTPPNTKEGWAKRKMGLIAVGAIVLILLLIIGGLWAIFGRSGSNSNNATVTATTAPVAAATVKSTATLAPTATLVALLGTPTSVVPFPVTWHAVDVSPDPNKVHIYKIKDPNVEAKILSDFYMDWSFIEDPENQFKSGVKNPLPTDPYSQYASGKSLAGVLTNQNTANSPDYDPKHGWFTTVDGQPVVKDSRETQLGECLSIEGTTCYVGMHVFDTQLHSYDFSTGKITDYDVGETYFFVTMKYDPTQGRWLFDDMRASDGQGRSMDAPTTTPGSATPAPSK